MNTQLIQSLGIPINSQFYLGWGRVLSYANKKSLNTNPDIKKKAFIYQGGVCLIFFVWFILQIEPKASHMRGILLKFKTMGSITIKFILPLFLIPLCV